MCSFPSIQDHYGRGRTWRECCEAVTEAAFLGLQEKRPGTEMAREREVLIFAGFGSKIRIGAYSDVILRAIGIGKTLTSEVLKFDMTPS